MNKCDAVLAILRTFGDRGVHSFSLRQWGGFRASARIRDLRKKGYQITSTQEKMGNSWGVRYKLIESEK